MSKPDLKAALRTASRLEENDVFDLTAAQMVAARDSSGLIELPTHQLRPNANQPRRVFQETALEELAESLRQVGMLQPILVRLENGTYVIIAGERRWRAAQRAGLPSVPVLVRTMDDNTTLEAALTENLQRENLTPVEEAQIFRRMIDELGYSIRKLAERLGKGKGYVEDRLRIARMAPELQALVSGRPDTLTHAREIEKVEDPSLRGELIRKVENEALPLNEVRRQIRALTASHPPFQGETSAADHANITSLRPSAVSGRPDTSAASAGAQAGKYSSGPPATDEASRLLMALRDLRHQIVAFAAADTFSPDPRLNEELAALTTAIANLQRRLRPATAKKGKPD